MASRASLSPFLTLTALSTLVLAACSSSSPSNDNENDAGNSSGNDASSASGDGGSGSETSTMACTPSSFEWATSGGGAGQSDVVQGAATDKDGNTWVAGTFIGSSKWGTFNLTAPDKTHTSAFFAKLDPTGKVLLARAIGGVANGEAYASRIRVDANGDAYLVGHYTQNLDLDGVHLVETNTGNGSVFLLKVDHATGTAIWGDTSSNGGDGETALDLALDSNGNAYVVGSYNGTTQFGSYTAGASSSVTGVFVAMYSGASKSWQWADGWSGMQPNTNDGGVARGVALSSDGFLYVTGVVAGTLKLGSTVLTNDQGGFLLKLGASDGHLVWVAAMGPGGSQGLEASAVALDGSNGVYVTGNFGGSPAFLPAIASGGDGGVDAGAAGLSVSTVGGGVDMFLAKYDTAGTPVWVKHAGQPAPSPGHTAGDDVTSDGTNVYVSGFAQNPTSFDALTLSASSSAFVAKYDGAGNIAWVTGPGTPGSTSGEGYAVSAPSATGEVVLGGSYASTLTAGATTLTSAGEDDAFVAKLCN